MTQTKNNNTNFMARTSFEVYLEFSIAEKSMSMASVKQPKSTKHV